MVDYLFPIPTSLITSGFTTSAVSASAIPQVALVPFQDAALGVHKVTANTTHAVVTPPASSSPHLINTQDPHKAWEALFPEGSINPGNKQAPRGGFGFYLRGPKDFAEKLNQGHVRETMMSYAVMFEDGWEWQKGGKLPGTYGGIGDSVYGCTGGRQTDRCKCFNLRLMWREYGAGELYAYLLPKPSNTEQLLKILPRSVQHPDYGVSVGMGSWHFVPGKWTSIAQRVRMNTVDLDDGEIEVYIDGQSVIFARGLVFRDHEAPDSHVQGLHFQTFFGGHTAEWASPKSQRAYFANISGAILRSSSGSQHIQGEL